MSKRRDQSLSPLSLRAGLAVLALTALALAAQSLVTGKKDLPVELLKLPEQESPLQTEYGEQYVAETFVSHLPLVVFDVEDQEPLSSSCWNQDKGYYVPVEGDPYAYGSLWVIDNENGVNRLTDEPAEGGEIRMRLRGNSSLQFPKKQYLIKFLDGHGNKKKRDILGMGKDSDWILNISWQDPSLLRNYLAYTLGKATAVETPDARYCELVRRRGDTYEYLGVYLFMETIKRGKNRVDIPKYRPNQTLSFLLRRDRYDETEPMLNTYATSQGRSEGFLGVKYPDKEELAPEDLKKIENKISAFEEVLYSEDLDTFLTYRNYIDLPSFVDYFVFNELIMNYDAGYNSTYLYLDYTGRLKMGPFWDFDQSLANDTAYVSNLESTAFHSAPWFRQLLRDPNYVLELEKRYHELRAGVFSDESLKTVIANARQYLGSAVARDWNRWQYEEAIPLNPYAAAPQSFEDASETLDGNLMAHVKWLDQHIDSLYQFSDPGIAVIQPEESAMKKAKRYSDLLAGVFVSAIIISALLLRREM